MSNQPVWTSAVNQSGENKFNSHTDEWGGRKLLGNLGTLIELKHGFVTVMGTLEAGSNIDNMPSFRITTYDQKNDSQSQHEILMSKMFLTQGIKVDDKVEIHGSRTERGFIKAIAILNVDTGVKTGKLVYSRPWLLVMGLLFLVIGIASSAKEKSSPLIIFIGVLFLLLFPFFKRKTKFVSERR